MSLYLPEVWNVSGRYPPSPFPLKKTITDTKHKKIWIQNNFFSKNWRTYKEHKFQIKLKKDKPNKTKRLKFLQWLFEFTWSFLVIKFSILKQHNKEQKKKKLTPTPTRNWRNFPENLIPNSKNTQTPTPKSKTSVLTIHSQSKLHHPELEPEPELELTTTTPVDFSQNPSSSSKITFRPRKIRKLISNNNKKPEPEPDHPNPSQLVTVLPIPVNPLTLEGEIDLVLNHLHSSNPLLTVLIDSFKPPAFESQSLPPESDPIWRDQRGLRREKAR